MIEFDAPLFKTLAHNDTGQAVGHQGGVVIPKDLDRYFPELSRRVTAAHPTQDEIVTAELFDGVHYLETVDTRYQFQTWGGTRSPERRLTGNLGAIRNLAHAGDLLMIERGISDDKRYRLTLIRQGTPQYNSIFPTLAGRRWGPLIFTMPPVLESEVEKQITQIENNEAKAFSLFDADADVVEARSKRVARSRAFQTHIAALYGRSCAMCGAGLQHPGGRAETEAAHIVPRRLKGSDDARNGVLLCRSHHWAFDMGLIGVSPTHAIVVPPQVLLIPANASLAVINGKAITLPNDASLTPHPDALAWHALNILLH